MEEAGCGNPGCHRASAGSLVGRAGFLDLVSAYWSVGSFPDMAGWGFCGVLTLVLASWCVALDSRSAGLVVQDVSVLVSTSWYVGWILDKAGCGAAAVLGLGPPAGGQALVPGLISSHCCMKLSPVVSCCRVQGS